MPEDAVIPCDPFGTDNLQDRLKAFCFEYDLDMPKFWVFPPNGVYMCYAVSLHLKGNDRWEEFDSNLIFMLKSLDEIKNLDALENRLHYIIEDIGEPVVVTMKTDETAQQLEFFKRMGLLNIPVTWSDDNQNLYKVYVKGQLEMGGFVNLMEHVEYIGKEVIFKQ